MKLDNSWERALRSAQAALDKKAYDLVVLQVGDFTSVADYFVICTGRSDVQVQSICRAVEESMATVGVKPLAVEGFTHGVTMLELQPHPGPGAMPGAGDGFSPVK